MEENLRQNERITLSLEIVLDRSSSKREARIKDLSLGGCFVESLTPVTKGETVVFKVHFPTGKLSMLNGEVVNVFANKGFSLCFTVLTEEEENLIEQIISAHKGKVLRQYNFGVED